MSVVCTTPCIPTTLSPRGDEAERSIIFRKSLEGSVWLSPAREWEEQLAVMCY
jgi:hypothetical protein